jgi:hypothetical protein
VLLLNKDLEFVISNSELVNWRDGRWLDGFRLLGLLLYNRFGRLYRDRIGLRCQGGLYRMGKSRKDRRSKFVGSEGIVLYFGRFNDGYSRFFLRAFSISFHTFLSTAAQQV